MRGVALGIGLFAFGVCHFGALVGLHPWVFDDIAADSINEYVPYIVRLAEGIRHGSLSLYEPNLGMGTSLAAYAPGFLTDPFMLPALCFGGAWAVALLPWVLLAKSLTTGLAVDAWLRRLGLDPRATPVAGLFAASSGYMLVWDQHYAYATGLPLFALVLLGTAIRLERGTAAWLVLATALSTAFSPIWGYQILLATGMTMLGRAALVSTGPAQAARELADLAFFVLLGIALSAVVLVPSALVVLDSPRLGDGFDYGLPRFFFRLARGATLARVFGNDLNKELELAQNAWQGFYEDPALAMTGFFVVALVAWFVGATRRGRLVASLALALTIAFLVSQRAASLFSGFAAPYLRFTYLLVPIQAALVAAWLTRLFRGAIGPREWRVTTIATSVVVVLAFVYMAHASPLAMNSVVGRVFTRHPQVPVTLALACMLPLLVRRVSVAATACLVALVGTADLTLGSRMQFVGRTFVPSNPARAGGAYDDDADRVVRGEVARLQAGERLIRTDAPPNEGLVLGYSSTTAFVSFHEAGFVRFLDAQEIGPPVPANAALRSIGLDRPEVLGLLGVREVVGPAGASDPFLERRHTKGGVSIASLRASTQGIAFARACVGPELGARLRAFDRALVLRSYVAVEGRCPLARPSVAASPRAAHIRRIERVVGIDSPQWAANSEPDGTIDIRPSESRAVLTLAFDGPLVDRDIEIAFGLRAEGFGSVGLELVDERGRGIDLGRRAIVFGERVPVRIATHVGRAVALRVLVETTGRHVRLEGLRIFEGREDRAALVRELEAIVSSLPHPEVRYRARAGTIGIDVSDVHEPLIARIAIPFNRGFHATVDGRPRPLLRVDGGLVGVLLHPGDRAIRLAFLPEGTILGAATSLVAFLLALGLVTLPRRAARPLALSRTTLTHLDSR